MERIIKNFNLKNTFENGQCFRFNRYKDGYLGIAEESVIFIRQQNEKFFISGIDEQKFDSDFVRLFDLERDYAKINNSFKAEENLKRAMEFGNGMHIMAQNKWETLISFIISQNNNIARIKSIIEKISLKYGTPAEFDGNVFYLFPTPEQLKNATETDFARLGCGYRAKYLERTVKDYLDGKIDLERIAKTDSESAKKELVRLFGVGPKVADCILLFGMGFFDAFPVDTWIKQVMEKLYIGHSAGKAEIQAKAKECFGDYAGLAQQYLFYYARENKEILK